MRPAAFRRLLTVSLALLAAGCEGSPLPQEPTRPEASVPLPQRLEQDANTALAVPSRWAAAYLHAGAPTLPSYAPVPYLSYNQSGGPMNITKPTGTTGRYIVTFSGLSAVLGSKSTVHVTEYGLDDTYCKPTNGRLVNDKLEVRCFRAGTQRSANAAFTVVVIARESNAAFAYAHQPASTGYSAAATGTWNPGGATKVYRNGVGQYEVVFTDLARAIPPTVAGHAQVNAVGTGKAHCILEDWGNSATQDLHVEVRCYTPAGVLTDSKFNVLFQLGDGHLAYTYATQPSSPSYSPYPTHTWTPSGGSVTITRSGAGDYTVVWAGVDPAIVEGGTVHVTSASARTQCKATGLFDSGVVVHCFGPNGAPADAYYSVLLGS
jgi:hypothetical protein